jgi:DNA end-binding protein Ku
MARRSIWTGAISFGLVNVPVKLYSAIEQKEVHFNLVHETDGGRIHQKRVCDKDGEEVPWEEVAKGYPISKRKMVMVTPEELAALDPRASRTIDIVDFVDGAEISPLFYENSYYVGPADEGAAKAYALLRQAMDKGGKVAIARMVMRTKQYLCSLRPEGKLLVLTTMQYADEIRDPGEIDHVPGSVKVAPRELELAERLIDSLTSTFEPDRYEDEHRKKVLAMLEDKAKGKTIEAAPEAEEAEATVDLAAALAASLDKAGGGRAKAAGSRRARVSRAAAKRPRTAAAAKGRRKKA